MGSHVPQSSPGEKKAAKLPALSETLIPPDANDAEATVLELDELWSFVRKQDHSSLDLDRLVSKDAASGGICGG